MKIAIVLLLIVSVVHCSSQCEDVSEYFSGIKDIVCPLWSGWGMAFANETCSKTISSSCDKIFDIIPKLIEFFTTFDMKKIMELLGDLYGVIKGVYDQFTDCKYIEYATLLDSHLLLLFHFTSITPPLSSLPYLHSMVLRRFFSKENGSVMEPWTLFARLKGSLHHEKFFRLMENVHECAIDDSAWNLLEKGSMVLSRPIFFTKEPLKRHLF